MLHNVSQFEDKFHKLMMDKDVPNDVKIKWLRSSLGEKNTRYNLLNYRVSLENANARITLGDVRSIETTIRSNHLNDRADVSTHVNSLLSSDLNAIERFIKLDKEIHVCYNNYITSIETYAASGRQAVGSACGLAHLMRSHGLMASEDINKVLEEMKVDLRKVETIADDRRDLLMKYLSDRIGTLEAHYLRSDYGIDLTDPDWDIKFNQLKPFA